MFFSAFDLETHLFAPGNMAPRPVALAYADGFGASLWACDDPAALTRIESLLLPGPIMDTLIIGHHVCYDFACLMARWPHLTERIFEAYAADRVTDTELRMKLLDLAKGDFRGFYTGTDGKRVKINYTLQTTAWRMCKLVLSKGIERTTYGELDGIPVSEWPTKHVDYALLDGTATRDTALAQEKVAQEIPGVLEDQFRQTRKHLALHLASVWGIVTNGETLEALAVKTKAKIEEHREELLAAGFLRKNGSRDMKAIYAALEAEDESCKRTDPSGRHAKGVPKADAETLARCKAPTLKALSGYGKAMSLLTGSIKDMRAGVDQPIHTWFDPILENGQTSSARPNVQNLRSAPGIRESIEPRPGFLLASCDYDMAQLHTLAQVCYVVLGHSALGEALNQGIDPHLMLGAQMIGITYEEAIEFKDDPEVKLARKRAKPGNFGFPGGMGVKGFLGYAQAHYGLAFEEHQAQTLRDNWLAAWPEMDEYFAWIRSLLAQTDVYTARQLGSNRLRAHCRYTVLANTFFSGLAHDAAGAALFEVARKMYAVPGNPLYGSRTITFPHDELIVEVPADPELADAAVRELETTMIDAFNVWVPKVPVHASAVLMHRWQKDAERVIVDGLIVPDPRTKEALT